MAKKEIDLASLKKAVTELDGAVCSFNPCYKEFVGSVMNTIDNCNSDFMVSLKKVLRAFKDNKMNKAIEAVERYLEDVEAVYKSLEAADQAVAQKIKEGKGK